MRDAKLWRFGAFELDEARQTLKHDGVEVCISTRPLMLLIELVRNAGHNVTRQHLFDTVWEGRILTDGVLSFAVRKLRQLLGESDEYIRTIYGVGFRFVAPLTATEAPALSADQPAIVVGTELPCRLQWRMERSLNSGGRAQVWLARHVRTREVHVFKLSNGERGRRALKREVAIWSLLNDVGRADLAPRLIDHQLDVAPYFVVFEYIQGQSLNEWIEQQGGLEEIPLDQRLELIAMLAERLSEAHAHGAIHGDVKPSNVLVRTHPAPELLLADFGSAQWDTPHFEISLPFLSQPISTAVGTAPYLSPEVLSGQAPSARSDAYAVGVMLYQFVVANPSRPLAPGWERDVDDPLLRSDIAALCDIDPAKRTDLRAAANALSALPARRAAETANNEQARALRVAQEQAARQRRRWRAALAIAIVVGLLAIPTVFAYQQAREAQRRAEYQARVEAQLADFFVRTLAGSANEQAGGRPNQTVRELLEIIGDELFNRDYLPEAEMRMHRQLAKLFTTSRDFPRAQRHVDRGLQLAETVHDIKARWGFQLALADQYRMQDRDAQAVPILEKLVSEMRASPDADPYDLASAEVALGDALDWSGHHEQARAHLVDVIPRINSYRVTEPTLWRGALNIYGRVLMKCDDAKGAEAVYLALVESGVIDPLLSGPRGLAIARFSLGQTDVAIKAMTETLDEFRKRHGNEHPIARNIQDELQKMQSAQAVSQR